MFLVSKAAWAGIIFILLTTGISGSRPKPVASGPDLSKELPVEHWNDVKNMQQILQDKGHYSGKVDGLLGLRTRAAIRGFQKAENLPATGQLAPQTADKLGVAPESHGKSGSASAQAKPSAGTKCVKESRRTRKTLRKAVASVAPEIDRTDRENTLPVEIDSPPH